nr:hypothetical protein Q903MT_gene325 [Picea sitchensis]
MLYRLCSILLLFCMQHRTVYSIKPHRTIYSYRAPSLTYIMMQ